VRIPNINQTGVPGAEQISLGAISSAAQASMKTTQALTKVVDDYQVMSNKAEAVAEYGQKYESSLATLDAAYDGMINSPHFDENNNPTYRDLEQRWNQQSMNHVTQTLNGFNNKNAATKYKEDASAYLRSKSSDIRGIVRKRQVDYSNGVLNLQLEKYKMQPDGVKKIGEAIETQMKLGTLDFDTGTKLLQTSLEDHASTQLTIRIQSAEDDGDLDQIMLELLQNEDQFLTLSAMQSAFTSIDQKESRLDQEIEDKQKTTYESMLIQVVSGELTSQTDIDLALRSTDINSSQFDDLSQRILMDMKGPEIDNWDEYTSVSMNLENYDVADILSNTMLTLDSRKKLVLEKGKLEDEKDKDVDWTKTQSGIEAKRRINEAWTSENGIFGRTSTAEAGEALTELYDTVIKLPLGQREISVVDIANKIIKRRKADKLAQGVQVVDKDTTFASIASDYPPGKERTKLLKKHGQNIGMNVPPQFHTLPQNDALEQLQQELDNL
tara:strand:+ start:202 stop:1689 length:1488 start_codon:yes stop_codon:yes gene_type:complete